MDMQGYFRRAKVYEMAYFVVRDAASFSPIAESSNRGFFPSREDPRLAEAFGIGEVAF